jgi:hypothetical protein
MSTRRDPDAEDLFDGSLLIAVHRSTTACNAKQLT